MYELFILIEFILIFMLNKLRIAQSFIFITYFMTYIFNDINIISDITFKVLTLFFVLLSTIIIIHNISESYE